MHCLVPDQYGPVWTSALPWPSAVPARTSMDQYGPAAKLGALHQRGLVSSYHGPVQTSTNQSRAHPGSLHPRGLASSQYGPVGCPHCCIDAHRPSPSVDQYKPVSAPRPGCLFPSPHLFIAPPPPGGSRGVPEVPESPINDAWYWCGSQYGLGRGWGVPSVDWEGLGVPSVDWEGLGVPSVDWEGVGDSQYGLGKGSRLPVWIGKELGSPGIDWEGISHSQYELGGCGQGRGQDWDFPSVPSLAPITG